MDERYTYMQQFSLGLRGWFNIWVQEQINFGIPTILLVKRKIVDPWELKLEFEYKVWENEVVLRWHHFPAKPCWSQLRKLLFLVQWTNLEYALSPKVRSFTSVVDPEFLEPYLNISYNVGFHDLPCKLTMSVSCHLLWLSPIDCEIIYKDGGRIMGPQ